MLQIVVDDDEVGGLEGGISLHEGGQGLPREVHVGLAEAEGYLREGGQAMEGIEAMLLRRRCVSFEQVLGDEESADVVAG